MISQEMFDIYPKGSEATGCSHLSQSGILSAVVVSLIFSSGQSHRPWEPAKEIEGGGCVRLHKEDYMITAVPSQRKSYPRHATADLTCGEPQSREHPQRGRDNSRELLGRHEKTNNECNVQRQQQKLNRPHASSIHRRSAALQGPDNISPYWVGSETADPSHRLNRQDLSPSGGDRQPPSKYRHDDDNTGLRSYKVNCDPEYYPQFIKPDVSDLFPQRKLEPSARSGHYYRQDNYGGQSQKFRQQHSSPYARDPTWDQAPMDLSRHTAVGAQDCADVGFGYRSQEYDLQTRQQVNSNLKVRKWLNFVMYLFAFVKIRRKNVHEALNFSIVLV